MSHTFYDGGSAVDAAGPVTWTQKRLDGTTVNTGTATHGGTGQYSFPLPASAVLDTHTVDWSGTFGGAAVTVRDFVEHVGGFLFSLYDARNMPSPLSASLYSDAMLAKYRIGTEQECEDICRVAFVPRFKRRVFSGNGTPNIVTPDLMLRTLRAITVNGTPFTGPELAAVGVTDSGLITLDTGWTAQGVWPRGNRNIIAEYEHGYDMPSQGISEAAVVRLRSRLTKGDTTVPYRAISFSTVEGGTYRLSTPGRYKTGIPDVDAAYEGATLDPGGFA
jgi:hypothetical protein